MYEHHGQRQLTGRAARAFLGDPRAPSSDALIFTHAQEYLAI
jgi:hypothetical protein